MEKHKYVIIGSGPAGINAAKTISENTQEPVLVITEETHPHYYRPKIIDYMGGTASIEEFQFYDEKWYLDREIQVLYNTTVNKISVQDRTVKMGDGNFIQYEKLLLATGGKPFIPKPFEGINGLVIRSLNDGETIIKTAETVKTFCIIGGGLLGLEAAGALAKLGKTIHVIETAPYPLPRQLDEEGGVVLKNKLAAIGIYLHTGSGISEINEKNVKLSDGSDFAFDRAIICTGIKPALDLVSGIGIEIDKAIVVNEYMETSAENIYAAGDVCAFKGELYGSWMPAMEQGEIAGLNMCGKKTEYKGSQKSYRLKVVGVDLVSMGNITSDSKVKILDESRDIYKKAFITDGKLEGFILYGDTHDETELLKNLSKDFSLSEEYFTHKERQMAGKDMRVCDICGYVYDPAKGDPGEGIAAGTPFDSIPDNWCCPICGAEKKKFSAM